MMRTQIPFLRFDCLRTWEPSSKPKLYHMLCRCAGFFHTQVFFVSDVEMLCKSRLLWKMSLAFLLSELVTHALPRGGTCHVKSES